jgi:fatty-acyl-CoA synthase
MENIYERDLDRNPANYSPLTPLSYLERAAYVYPERIAVIHGDVRRTWGELYARCRRLGSALSQRGIGIGDTVAAMLPNIPAMVDVHFGVAMAGAVLNTLNTRLDAEAIAFMLDHGEAKVLITDREFSETVRRALELCSVRPLVIDVDDPLYSGPGERIGSLEYESFLAGGDPGFAWRTGVCRSTPSTCGRCRCSIATAGASSGRLPRSRGPVSACAGSRPRRSSTRFARTR